MTHDRRRRLGQHFLEPAWVAKLLDIVAPAPHDDFLEIGAGRGALTLALARRCARLVAVEIDPRLAAKLTLRAPTGATVVPADFLRLDLDALDLGRPARAVGNLPYSAATAILLKLLGHSARGARLSDATLMLQREVAERVTAAPGSRGWGPLAVATRLHAEPRRVLTLPPGAFRPMPRVQSAVVHLRFRAPEVRPADPAAFDLLVRAMFTQRRKTALNALRPHAARLGAVPAERIFEQAQVDPRLRPEQLDLAALAALSDALAASRH